jgi:hypothetical protein
MVGCISNNGGGTMRIRVGRCVVASVVVALAGLSAGSVRAQDSNYWSQAYGTRSQLLGGVVVGSPIDISSVYYNPGALALAPRVELLLSGAAYKYQRVSVDGGSGPGKNLVSSWLAAAPSLFAGEIPVLKNDRLAYAYLDRQEVNLELSSRFSSGSDIPATASRSALELQLKQHISEDWFGMTWAHKLSPDLGFGVSPYLAVRSQETGLSYFTSSQDAALTGTVLNVSRNFDYEHWRLLAKLGLSGVRDSLTYGLALTTPGLGVHGGGNLRSNTTRVDETGVTGDLAGASYQKDVKTNFHSPVAIGAGASYGWGSTRIHATAEWNNEVPLYEVMHGASYLIRTPSGDSTVTPIIVQKLDAVFNVGVGIEHQLSSTVIGYAGFHTDNSGRAANEPANASITNWDLKHVSAGASWHVHRSDITFGGTAAFSSQKVSPVTNLNPDGSVDNGLQSHVLFFTVLAGWKLVF